MTATTSPAPTGPAPTGPVPTSALSANNATLLAAAPGVSTVDRIAHVKLSSITLPLATPISDAKVLTGRQKPMTEVAFLFAEIDHRARPHRHRLQLLQARRRPRPVRPRQGDRRRPDRRGPQRHRQALGQAGLGRRLGRPQRARHPGHRRLRRRAVGPQGQARRPAAGQAARRAPRFGAGLQHLRRLPARRRSSRWSRTAAAVARGRHRRHQDQGRPARPDDRPRPGGGGPRAPRRRRAADGRRQPAVGPADRACGSAALFEEFNLVWIEEPLDAYDAEGHAQLAARWTPRSPPARC